MRKARKGTNVVYIPGNHDEAARQYCQLTFGDVRVEDEAIHETPDGRKLLIIHGDQFDGIVRYARWLAILGDWAYAAALRLNTMFNWGRRKLGLPYWSLSAFLKHRVKNAVQFIDDFENAVAERSAPPRRRRRGVRPHPSRRDAHDRGHPLLQRRRLGRELHRAGRGFRRPPAHRALGRRGGRAVSLAAASVAPCNWRRSSGLRIAIVSDAWRPQINGVVRTLETVARLLRAEGHEVEVFGPDRFRTLPCPTYPEIRLSLFPSARLSHMLKLFAPDAIHLVTEGPLGWAARGFCRRRGIPFTTAYHTRFPEYVRARIRVPLSWSYAFVRRFHAPSSAVLVVSPSIRDELTATRLQEPRAVVARRRHRRLPAAARATQSSDAAADLALCRPRRHREEHQGLPRPRPARHQVGGGRRPAAQVSCSAATRMRTSSARSIPTSCRMRYAEADCFVFPSRTDTFGLVMVEALASGVPVAGYPVPGPLDVVTDPKVGALDEDLRTACLAAVRPRSGRLPAPRRDLHLGTLRRAVPATRCSRSRAASGSP